MRYRMEFSKEKKVCFVSHLELMKVFSQAIRRAQLPVAWTEGFNPRPKISFSSAIATGMVSLAECMDLELTTDLEPEEVRERLNRQLPPGFSVGRIRRLDGRPRSLMALMKYADYRIRVSGISLPGPEAVEKAAAGFTALPGILREVKGPKGPSVKDLRPGLIRMETSVEKDILELRLRLRSGSQGNTRPEHVTLSFLEYLGTAGEPVLFIEKTAVLGEDEEQVRELYLL